MKPTNLSIFLTHFLVATLFLVFSQPLDTLAQQTSALQIEAKTAAERDANRDINKPLWFGAGLGVGVSGAACLVAGGYIGLIRDERSGHIGCGPGPCMVFGGLTGLAVGISVPLIVIVNYQATPPPERLLGKSPEYVLTYTLAYEKKMRWLRIKWALGGPTGCVGLLM